MIEMTFREFYEYKYDETELYELYIAKNGLDEVLYIGISGQAIWNRWFGWNGHIREGENYLIGVSSVGEKIVDHLPDSWGWKIQLWTLNDCREFCADELDPQKGYDIKFFEPFMVKKLHPVLNSHYNLNPGNDNMPKSEREKRREAELDRIYREVFESKNKKV